MVLWPRANAVHFLGGFSDWIPSQVWMGPWIFVPWAWFWYFGSTFSMPLGPFLESGPAMIEELSACKLLSPFGLSSVRSFGIHLIPGCKKEVWTIFLLASIHCTRESFSGRKFRHAWKPDWNLVLRWCDVRMNFLGGLACFCSSACKAMGMLAKKLPVRFWLIDENLCLANEPTAPMANYSVCNPCCLLTSSTKAFLRRIGVLGNHLFSWTTCFSESRVILLSESCFWPSQHSQAKPAEENPYSMRYTWSNNKPCHQSSYT